MKKLFYWQQLEENYMPKPRNRSSVRGINMLSKYLHANGGPGQQSRMILDKRRSFDKAVLYSYQGAFIKKYLPDGLESLTFPEVRALINPNKLKQDYDDKILSVGFEHEFEPGDIFEWCQTGTYWLIYLQDLTELAYFRGDIRKCSHEICWTDEDGNVKRSFAAIRGPVETKINYIQKHGISVDEPNYSLNILMPKTESTLNYFKRYSKFYLQNDENKICWRVEATDWISTPGILEIVAVEYYANETEDDIENGLVGTLKLEKINPNNKDLEKIIKGDTFIKPKNNYTYVCNKRNLTNWTFDKNLPIKIIDKSVNENNRSTITLQWTASYSGQFDLKIGNYSKTIIVESLF